MKKSKELNSGIFLITCTLISTALLASCSSESKAAPYLKQICSDWKTSGYTSGSIVTRENLASKFSSQVIAAVALDPEASAEFQIAVNLMKNVSLLENQEAEYSAKGFVEGSQYWRDLASARASEASAEEAKVVSKFIDICKEYQSE
jgi:hypothetical protein